VRESPPEITTRALFLAFAEMAISSFGGALIWARRVLVERRRWLTDREFAELLGLCQALPGPNVVNLSIFFGLRTRGTRGAAAAFAGLLVVPLLVLIPLAAAYAYGGQLDVLRAALRGVAAAAAGLLIATGLRLALTYRTEPRVLLIAGLAFVAVGLLRWPLLAVLAVLAPCSIALAWRRAS
jgi:chromate transporter